MKQDSTKRKFYLKYVAFVFFCILATYVILWLIFFFAAKFGFFAMHTKFKAGGLILIIVFMAASLAVGFVISLFTANIFLKPINTLSDAMKRVAKGDFSVQLEDDGDNEMSELIVIFNRMVKDLRDIEMMKDDFITNISHEFKTPLATIQGYSTFLQDETLTPEERETYVSCIIAATRQLTNLTSNILRLSKLENGGSVEKTRFDGAEQIRRAILALEPQWTDKNIEFDIELVPAELNANEELLAQVWTNIIGNAIKFSPENSKIEVRSQSADGVYKVEIRDHGIGMDEATKDRIFDKFYQGDNSHSKEGNGLGLALVKKILEVSGGSVEVESAPGQGSLFTVSIAM